jgi:hypothetical protein
VNFKDMQQLMTDEEMAIFKKEVALSPVICGQHGDGYCERLIFFSKEQGCLWFYQQDKKDPKDRAFLPNTWVLRKCKGEWRNPESILTCHRHSAVGQENSCCFAAITPLCKLHGIP